MATATDDNAEIRNLDARLFEKSTCWHTRYRKNNPTDMARNTYMFISRIIVFTPRIIPALLSPYQSAPVLFYLSVFLLRMF